MNYSELLTNVRNYTEVDNNVFSDAVINSFITFAENRILRDIDLDVSQSRSRPILFHKRRISKF